MTRTNAREIAVHLVFAMAYTQESQEEIMERRFDKEYYATLPMENAVYEQDLDEKQKQYMETILQGVTENREMLNEKIQSYSVGWGLHRISKLVVSILQVTMFEILHVEDVPMASAVNEAVELTRKYEDEDVVSFVNGILGSFCRGLSQP